jgi:hypothetical protein
MLNADKLCSDITNAFKETLPSALEEAFKATLPTKSDAGDKLAKNFGKYATDLCAEDLGDRIGNAIHAYIKNISISGTVITTGSPTTQTASIMVSGPVTAGKIPNTLGIS